MLMLTQTYLCQMISIFILINHDYLSRLCLQPSVNLFISENQIRTRLYPALAHHMLSTYPEQVSLMSMGSQCDSELRCV